jgi:hypothetical protein
MTKEEVVKCLYKALRPDAKSQTEIRTAILKHMTAALREIKGLEDIELVLYETKFELDKVIIKYGNDYEASVNIENDSYINMMVNVLRPASKSQGLIEKNQKVLFIQK